MTSREIGGFFSIDALNVTPSNFFSKTPQINARELVACTCEMFFRANIRRKVIAKTQEAAGARLLFLERPGKILVDRRQGVRTDGKGQLIVGWMRQPEIDVIPEKPAEPLVARMAG